MSPAASVSFLSEAELRVGGELLAVVKNQLVASTQVGDSFSQIEDRAQALIKKSGAKPSFSTVPGYDWASCVMKNDELCHGIPVGDKQVADGDVITIDVGLLYKNHHFDTSVTFQAGTSDSKTEQFLEIGRRSLAKAIAHAKPGNSVYDISKAMQKVVERTGFGAVYQLTGHGIGKNLHQEPGIPCVAQKKDKKLSIVAGQVLAIEIMYSAGDPDLCLDADKWTYRSCDGSLTGMFEETVYVSESGPVILTK